jgi:hypothetical protein
MFAAAEEMLVKNAYSEADCKTALISKLENFAKMYGNNELMSLYALEKAASDTKFGNELSRSTQKCEAGEFAVAFNTQYKSYRNFDGGELTCKAVNPAMDPVIRLFAAISLSDGDDDEYQTSKPYSAMTTEEKEAFAKSNTQTIESLAEGSRDPTRLQDLVDTICEYDPKDEASAEDQLDECKSMIYTAAEQANEGDGGGDQLEEIIRAREDVMVNKECNDQDMYDFMTKDLYYFIKATLMDPENPPVLQTLINAYKSIEAGNYTPPSAPPSVDPLSDSGSWHFPASSAINPETGEEWYESSYEYFPTR